MHFKLKITIYNELSLNAFVLLAEVQKKMSEKCYKSVIVDKMTDLHSELPKTMLQVRLIPPFQILFNTN